MAQPVVRAVEHARTPWCGARVVKPAKPWQYPHLVDVLLLQTSQVVHYPALVCTVST